MVNAGIGRSSMCHFIWKRLDDQRPQHQPHEVLVELRLVRRVRVGERAGRHVEARRLQPLRADEVDLPTLHRCRQIPRQADDPIQWTGADVDLSRRQQLRARLLRLGRARLQDRDFELRRGRGGNRFARSGGFGVNSAVAVSTTIAGTLMSFGSS